MAGTQNRCSGETGAHARRTGGKAPLVPRLLLGEGLLHHLLGRNLKGRVWTLPLISRCFRFRSGRERLRHEQTGRQALKWLSGPTACVGVSKCVQVQQGELNISSCLLRQLLGAAFVSSAELPPWAQSHCVPCSGV